MTITKQTVEYSPAATAFFSVMLDALNEIGHPCEIPVPDGLSTETFDACLHLVQHTSFPRNFRISNYVKFVQEWDVFANYVGISLKCPVNDWMLVLQDNDKDNKLFADAVRDNLHRMHVYAQVTGVSHLIRLDDTFDATAHRVELNLKECSIIECASMPREFNASGCTKSLDDYFDRLKDFPWYNGTYGAVIAGGCVVASTFGYTMNEYMETAGDIDIMIVADCKEVMAKIFADVIVSIRSSHPWAKICENFFDYPNRSRVTNVLASSNGVTYDVKFQIIRIMYPSPYHIVTGFDIDVCGMLYFPGNIYITPNAARACVNGFNLYDANKLSKTAEKRIVKYCLKYGLKVLIGGLSQSFLENKINLHHERIMSFNDNAHDVVTLIKLVEMTKVPPSATVPVHKRMIGWYVGSDKDYDNAIGVVGGALQSLMAILRWARSKAFRKYNYYFFPLEEGPLTGSFFPVKSNIVQRFLDL